MNVADAYQLVFTCIVVACVLGMAIYFAYIHYYLVSALIQESQKHVSHTNTHKESGHSQTWTACPRTQAGAGDLCVNWPANRAVHLRLVSFTGIERNLEKIYKLIPWNRTSRADVHWIASIIGITLFGVGAFVLFQCIFMVRLTDETTSLRHTLNSQSTCLFHTRSMLPAFSQPMISSAPVLLRAPLSILIRST